MRCPHCQSLIEQATRCPECGKSLTARREFNAASLLLLIAAVALVGWLGYRQLGSLAQQTGVQWDTEMTGPWTRTSDQQAGFSLYRIHIKNQADQVLDEQHRVYQQGDKVVAAFHFRAADGGRVQPRLVLTGPTQITPKLPRPMDIQGGYGDFKATLIPFAIPPDAQPGSYQFRLEVEDLRTHKTGFWETDFEIVAKP
ncbi:MAG: hypothetical protein KC910_26875 [Candidatus Eremiobacteraeota bacterium]|nr:hypothetical protein [Candidatus Eremiobacteraeota bacterium]